MEKDYLILKRASASRPSGQWKDDDYDVLADGVVVGRIFNAKAAPVGQSWMWTLLFEHHKNRTPTHGYAATREAAMAALAKSWRLRQGGPVRCPRSLGAETPRQLALRPFRGGSAFTLRQLLASERTLQLVSGR